MHCLKTGSGKLLILVLREKKYGTEILVVISVSITPKTHIKAVTTAFFFRDPVHTSHVTRLLFEKRFSFNFQKTLTIASSLQVSYSR